MTAVFGLSTKFTECTLALNFRRIGAGGEVAGGPMYTLLHGLNMKRAATLFAASALVASFGIGNMVQANSVVDGLGYLFPPVRDNAWLAGTPLDISQILYTPAGKPRIAIFSIAHLSDPERMFFVSMLLNELIAWMPCS